MPPPDNGNEYTPFRDLMALEKVSQNCFKSKALAFGPANGRRAYGGHVYSQACYAAAQTVGKDMILHNVTGWFLLAGKTDEKFIYNVRTIRDGGYCTRGVDVVQEKDPGFCFTCICSFKRPEKTSQPNIDVQRRLDVGKEYRIAIGDKRPDEHHEMWGIDAPWFWEFSRAHNDYNDPFPGLRLHKVDMDPYNKGKHPLDRRSLKYYAVRGSMPSPEDDPNLHACAHLYASDRNSLFVISNHLDIGNNYSHMASLAHTVIFHADKTELDMMDSRTGEARWFCQEAWTGGARQGRGLHETRLWRNDGLHVASTMQDGMVRLKNEEGKGKVGFSPDGMVGSMEKLWREKQGKL